MAEETQVRMQNAVDSLEGCRARVEDFLRDYLDERMWTLVEADRSLGRELGDVVKSAILDGGKRMRAALVYYGYRAVGGEEDDRILFASAATEILHSFFLIHDDIVDRSDVRRGRPAAHRQYLRLYQERGLLNHQTPSDREHFGYSAAIMVGDVCCALAYEALLRSGFDEKRIVEGLRMMQETVLYTGVGEMLDIVRALDRKATEEEVMQIHYLKTARYTIESPLMLGAIMHGTTGSTLEAMAGYGRPVGVAFQIHDDILGLMGSAAQLGKPVGSDLREGKQTLLTVWAFQNASDAQKQRMESTLGNAGATDADVEEFKRIAEDTGALEYSRNRAASLVEEGKAALVSAEIRDDMKEVLLGFADYVVGREL